MEIIKVGTDTIIKYESMWDGLSNQATGPGIIHIRNGHITENSEEQTPASVLDFSNHTVMPTLMDCHVHLSLPYKSKDTPADRANNLLQSGIAAVRDAGSRQSLLHSLPPLTVINTVHAISKAGYYGANLGTTVENVLEAEQVMNRLADTGAKQIKLIASGIFSFSCYGDTGPIPFTTNELTRIVTHAQKQGLKVMAHATGNEAVSRCLDAGVDSIEHGYFMTEKTLEKMAKDNVCWIPTLIPAAIHLSSPQLFSQLSAIQRGTIRRTLAHQQQLVAKAAELNVCIGAGSDAGALGVPHGPSLYWELRELARCGLSAVTTLKTATSSAARICDLPDLGTIAPTKKLPLLVVAQNPLQQMATLEKPVALLI